MLWSRKGTKWFHPIMKCQCRGGGRCDLLEKEASTTAGGNPDEVLFWQQKDGDLLLLRFRTFSESKDRGFGD